MEKKHINACQNGDLEAFGALYDQYLQPIYQFIYFKTHHRETAEDLTSQTFIKALKAIQSFDTKKASFKTWLYQIARNTVIDHYRSFKQERPLEDAWNINDKADVERDVDFQLKIEAVESYLETLKPEQREIILLRLWGGHAFAEIAEITGKTEAACKMNFKRSMEKLRCDFAPLLLLLLTISSLWPPNFNPF